MKSFTALWLGLFSKGHHQTGHALCVAIQLTLLFCKGRKRNQFSQIYDFHHRPLSRSCAFSVLRTGCPNPNCMNNKVHIFLEGHKILRNLHQLFDWQYIGQIIGGEFAKLCGLLRVYELYKSTKKC